ncbi:MAG: FtsW/RodA/SpoVE family cell cycle protein [Acidobacteria bacterium]|nr:FtsW/RodA/SpoVE family cell cycle protein [Acidobacteriota bacterium]
MKQADGSYQDGSYRAGRDLLILAAGVLPAHVLGLAWMREAGVPPTVYMQNVVALIAGAAIAVFGPRRHVPPIASFAVTALSVVLLLATLVTRGMQGVHRWIQLGPLTLHVASLSIPLVLIELDGLLRQARFAIAIGAILAIAVILAVQPDAGQASAFAGSAIVLLVCGRKRVSVTVAAALALIALATISLLRSDPLAPVPYVEEIAPGRRLGGCCCPRASLAHRAVCRADGQRMEPRWGRSRGVPCTFDRCVVLGQLPCSNSRLRHVADNWVLRRLGMASLGCGPRDAPLLGRASA